MASATVGILRVLLTANSAEFESAMKRSASSAQAWSKDLKSIGQQATQLGSALTRTLTLPLIGLGVGLIKVGKDFDTASDSIRSATGATGADLDSLNASFKKVFATVPTSMKDASAAIGDLHTRTGQTGAGLETLTAQMLNLARVGKTEIGGLVAATTRAFGDWSISTEHQSAALDFLFKTSQSTGIGVTRLTELVVQFGAPLRALGFDFESSAALMGKFEKEGVNLETVLSGLRFALGNFAKAGLEPAQALRDVQAAILGAKTESEATAIAFQTFGKRAAIDMSRAIIEGRFNIDELVRSLKNSKETINSAAADTLSLGEKFQLLGQRTMTAVEPLATSLVVALEHALTSVEPLTHAIGVLAQGFGTLPTWVQATAIGFGLAAAAIGPLLWGFGQLATGAGILIAQFTTKGLVMRGLTGAMGLYSTSMTAATGATAGLRTGLVALLGSTGGLLTVFGSLAVAWATFKGDWTRAFDILIPPLGFLRTGLDAMVGSQKKSADAARDQAGAYQQAADGMKELRDSLSRADLVSQMDKLNLIALELETMGEGATPRMLRLAAAAEQLKAQHVQLTPALERVVELYGAAAPKAERAAASTAGLSAELAAVQKVMAGFTAQQKADIVAGDKMGDSNKEIAQALKLTGVSAEMAEKAVKLYLDSFKGAKTAAKDVRELTDAINKLSGKSLVDTGRDLEKQLKLLGGQSKVLITELPALSEGFKKAAEGARNLGDVVLAKHFEDLAKATDPANEALRRSGIALESVGGFAIDADASLHALWEEVHRLSGNTLTFASQKLETFAQALVRLGKIQPGFEMSQTTFSPIIPGSVIDTTGVTAGKGIGAAMLGGIGESLKGLPDLFTQAFTGGGGVLGALKGLGVQIANSIITPMLQKLSKAGQLGVSVGSGIAAAVGGAVGGGTGATIGGIAAGLGAAAIKASAFGVAMTNAGIGGAIAIGAATAGIGLAAVGVYLLARRWFSVSGEIKEARKQVEEFQSKLGDILTPQEKAEAGGERWKETVLAVGKAYQGTGRSAADAEAIVKQLWDTDHPDRARAAIQKIADVMKEFAQNTLDAETAFDDVMAAAERAGGTIPAHMRPVLQQFIDLGLLTDDQAARLRGLADESEFDWRKMQAAGERYGEWMRTEMGQAFQQARLHEGAVEIINDFDRLTKGGASVGSVLFGMKEEISKLVQDSKKFGTEIPKNMQPWIQNLFDTGQLLDENGDKIEDISELKFGDAIKTEAEIAKDAWAAILGKIQELIDKITGPLQRAIDGVPNEVPVNFVGTFTPPDITHQGGEPVPLASGAIVRRATLALIGERGPEIVAPLASLPALAARVMGGAFRDLGISLPSGAITLPDQIFQSPGELIGRIDTKNSRRDDAVVEGITDRLAQIMRDERATWEEVLKISLRDAVQGVI